MLKAFAILAFLFTAMGSANAQYPYGGGPRFFGCVAYEHNNFRGGQLPVRGGESIEALQGFWNDRISSINCSRRCALTAFEHFGFRGRRQTFAGSVPYVGPFWNDRISSVAVECG
jgi:hypothetical protein